MFFWNSYFFHDPGDVGNLISGSSAFSKTKAIGFLAWMLAEKPPASTGKVVTSGIW